MATHPLVKRLQSLPDDVFWSGPRASPGDLAELEEAVGHRFPDDYRAVVLELGPWELIGPNARIVVMTISNALLSLEDERIIEDLPGMAVIATNGGGWAYYYDPEDKLGRGPFALYLVDYGTLTFEDSIFVAPSLTEAVDALLAGDDFMERDPIRGPR